MCNHDFKVIGEFTVKCNLCGAMGNVIANGSDDVDYELIPDEQEK